MSELIRGIKATAIFVGFSFFLVKLSYFIGMIAGLINVFYGAFCFIGVSGSAIHFVSDFTSVMLYGFLIVWSYRTFIGP